jgi:transposase
MTVEKMFHELLGLGMNWEVVESRFDKASGTVFLEIRETPRLWDTVRCPNSDGGKASCYDHTEVVTWRHLNVFEHRCEITCRLPRGKCRDCGHIFRVRPPWEGLSTHFTKAFEAYALLLMREMPMSKVAKAVRETDTRMWRMLFRHVDQAYAEADFSNTSWVAVDEMHVRKGHEYITVFADLAAKRVLFATEGKDKQTWAKFIAALQQHNGHQHAITQVSMDMSKAYQAGVAEYCRNAQVVFDKFHVIKKANEAVDHVKRAEIRLAGNGVWHSLKNTQWLWRKNPENLNSQERERLAELQNKKLHTAKAYQMRLLLQEIYRSPHALTARRGLKVWCRWVRWVARFHQTILYRSMVQLANMIEAHLKGILAHWKTGLTNAFMEGLNSVFSATKRKARGYRSIPYLTTMLYFTAGKLRLPHS